ncbi:rho guanine nucleotide exchange factor 11 isoform X3 [Uranotaenia lowii]|uniref:rho guanine nucleotide exchange factor 11 isoform X3 n=1 Tax=Uranotaenia lowii TaxID=190385 RepID=UPI00247A0616|nr:rho guanine nucleotide exchange factor 11 isoform X3 [Uranotaenia lowii]
MDNNVPSSGPSERSPLHHHHSRTSSSSNINGNANIGPQAQSNHHQHHQNNNINSNNNNNSNSSNSNNRQQRPQTLTPTRESPAKNAGSVPMLTLNVVVNKDANGYGMKVSGDKPVFVESVKPGGAAQKAGLMAEDMILKVNGTSVRSSTHTNVVELIKASDIVELTVQRSNNRMQRGSPSTTSITPTTPVAPRNSITAPLPVDHAKQREMEFHKIKTLRLMLEQEKKNLENLNSSNKQRTPESLRAEATIKKLQEELSQMCGEALNASNQPASHMNQSINKKHRRIVSSPENINAKDFGDHGSLIPRHQKTSSDSWDKRSQEITPPGTPPPPYPSSSSLLGSSGGVDGHHLHHELAMAAGVGNMNHQMQHHHHPQSASSNHQGPAGPGSIMAAQSNEAQKPIISMEDDEISDQESFIEEHGPFRSLKQLLEQAHSAHLAVFLNYVLSNSDPSPLLFYLISDLYKEGSIKDMRKWAYEIHSTFLVPGAPLLWPNVDESLAREIDDILQKENDKVEILRRVFYKSRNKARDYINIQLQEFQLKRTAGLGTMYGPTDQQLASAKGDKVREQRIVEETLLPKLQQYLEEIEKESPKECPKKSALCSALSTVLQRFFVTRSTPGSPIDKVHHFVSREKSFKSRLMAKNRKQDILGHNLRLQPYYEVTRCNHCQNILWGVSPQGYHCSNCELNIHRVCAKDLNEYCPGPAPLKNDSSKITKLMEKISSRNHHQADKMRRHEDDGAGEDGLGGDRPTSISLARQPSDRRQDFNSSNVSSYSDFLSNSTGDPGTFVQGADNDQFRDSVKSKSAPVSVNRSESYKERSQKKTRNTRRKTSDPSLTKTTDEQNEAAALINSNYSSSSTSSLPLALDSRSASLEAVGGMPPAAATMTGSLAGSGIPGSMATGTTTGAANSNASFAAAANSSILSNSSWSTTGAGGGPNSSFGTGLLPPSYFPTAREWVDSEDEGNLEPEADWSSNIPAEILATLSDAEKKRQEVINEIYQTERNHVRTLRLLEGIFMRPLQESGALPNELLQLLFPPSLRKLQELHQTFESNLKQRRTEHCNIVREIGDLLTLMFDGQSGEDLLEHAAYFCARQQIALEALKERRKKDENLQRLLIKAESHKACRRLQLKDLLPTALQRLTKYPLLFDSLYNITVRVQPDNETEAQAIKKAHEYSKRILDHVNQAVRAEEDAHKLMTIQRKLDKSGLDKDAPSEFRNIDLTVRKLIHDGPLTMKKNPGVQLHGLLFEDMMVLLQKQDEKYLLKYHSSPGLGGNESKITEGRFNPITKINLILVRQSAVDKNTFFLINTNVSQMLELTAPSSSECKTWFKHISDAADAYKARTKGSHDFSEDSATQPGQPPKDSFETVTEAQKIEQISTPIDRLERKDSTLQCRAVSTGGPGTAPSSQTHSTAGGQNVHGVHTKHTGSGGVHSSNNLNNNNEDSLPNKNRSINETDDNAENEDREKCKRRSMLGSVNGSSMATVTGSDEDDDDDDVDQKNDPDDSGSNMGGRRRRGRESNSTRARTQECSLVAPSEIHVSVSNTLTAEPILTPSEKLRRLDQAIRKTLVEKQRIVCDMFKVPDEHFLAIADIAGLPEAPQKEPTDMILAAFAHIQSLTDVLNEHLRVTQSQEISAVSTSICDDCNRSRTGTGSCPGTEATAAVAGTELNGGSVSLGTGNLQSTNTADPGSTHKAQVLPTSGGVPPIASVLQSDHPVNITEDEDGYCEIDEVRAAAVLLESQLAEAEKLKKLAAEADAKAALESANLLDDSGGRKSPDSHTEINENYESAQPQPLIGIDLCGRNRLLHASSLVPTIPCHLIASYVTGLNAQISQLLPKISERDLEREQLRKENLHLRELLNAMHQEKVLETQETIEVPVTESDSQSPAATAAAVAVPPPQLAPATPDPNSGNVAALIQGE